MAIEDIFNYYLDKQSRSGKINRIGTPVFPAQEVNIKYSPTSYTRISEAPENMVVKGRQFIITKRNLTASGFVGNLKRGDRIVDTEFGSMTIREIEEMYDFGPARVIGYRCSVD